jgi:S1-C subfamily serine protease
MKKNLMILISILLVAFCFSSDTHKVKKQKKQKKEKAYMGVALKEVQESDSEKKVVIINVIEDSAADDAGLSSEDLILMVNGKKIKDIKEIKAILKEMAPEENVDILVKRGDKTKDIELILKGEPHSIHLDGLSDDIVALIGDDEDEVFGHLHKRAMFIGEPQPYVGIQLKSLSGQLAGYFGVEFGVLIEEVSADSPAASAGLQAGDVIVGAGNMNISKTSELMGFLHKQRPGDEVLFKLVRKKKNVELAVVLGENKSQVQTIFEDDGDIQINRWVDEKDGTIKVEVKTTIEKEE